MVACGSLPGAATRLGAYLLAIDLLIFTVLNPHRTAEFAVVVGLGLHHLVLRLNGGLGFLAGPGVDLAIAAGLIRIIGRGRGAECFRVVLLGRRFVLGGRGLFLTAVTLRFVVAVGFRSGLFSVDLLIVPVFNPIARLNLL